MKRYISDILRLFATGEHTPLMQRRVWHWLNDTAHADEKDEALKSLFDEGCDATQGSAASAETTRAWHDWLGRIGLDDAPAAAGSFWRRAATRAQSSWRVAATVLLLVAAGAAGWLLRGAGPSADLMQQYVPLAQMERLTLPDGSAVQLNAGSTLIYPPTFSGSDRSVYLVGEANFKVAKDAKHPFRVKGDDFQVEALGTEFDVNIYPEASEVRAVLLEGSVAVSYDDMRHRAILHPGEQLVYDRRTRTSRVEVVDLDDATAWQRGEMVFSGATVAQVLDGIERHFGCEMSYSARWASSDRYSFRFRPQATLREVMEIVSGVVDGMHYELSGNHCRVDTPRP